MDLSNYQATYQPNMYYQPTVTTPVYQQRWIPQQQQYPVTPVQPYQQNQNQQPINNQMIWVQGEAGAKAYVLPNGTTLPLWDSESQTIYIKSVDANGRPSMTILDYTDRNAPVEQKEEKVEYATKEQVDGLMEKINSFGKYVTKEQLESLNTHLDDLSSQIEDIENRIMSFGKPQQNNSNNRKGNN